MDQRDSSPKSSLSCATSMVASARSAVPRPFRIFFPGRLLPSFRKGWRNSTMRYWRPGFSRTDAVYILAIVGISLSLMDVPGCSDDSCRGAHVSMVFWNIAEHLSDKIGRAHV